MRALLCIPLLLGVMGSSCTRPPPIEPPMAQCNAICYKPCTGENDDTGVRWAGNPSDANAWDALAGEIVPALSEKLRACEQRRKSCVQCLDRLESNGVIRQ